MCSAQRQGESEKGAMAEGQQARRRVDSTTNIPPGHCQRGAPLTAQSPDSRCVFYMRKLRFWGALGPSYASVPSQGLLYNEKIFLLKSLASLRCTMTRHR